MVLLITGAGLAALLLWAANSVPAYQSANAGAPVAKEAAGATPAVGVRMATSRVSAVTVYANNALVTREVDVPEGPGLIELTVTPLPPSTVNGSLHTEGTEGIRVLATRFRTRPVQEDPREDVRRLQDELKQLQAAQEKLEGDMKAAQANSQLLTKLEGFTATTATHAADKGAPSGESAIALAKYVMETRAEKSKEIVALQQQLQANQEKTEFARRKLNELAWSPNRTERDAVIVVDKANAAAGKVKLSYLVDDALWRPEYKLRAGKGAKDPVRLEYMAAVTQHTGEDWSNVELVLSTAQSTLNAAPPDLQVLQITVVPNAKNSPGKSAHGESDLEEQVRSLRMKAQRDFNMKKLATGVGLFNTAAALGQSWELLNPEAACRQGCAMVTREGPSVNYHLDSRLTLPSRTEEQNIEITRIDFVPDYYYKAVPVLTSHVYRLAKLTNKSNFILLPGEATLFVGSDFVGQMNLPLVAIGEQFTPGFGVDPQLQVQRQMIGQTRSTQGGNAVTEYKYLIRLLSYKSEPVKVQVWDRLPHAETETAGVSLIKSSREIVSDDDLYVREQRPNNLLRWDVDLDAGMSGKKALEITYDFKLEHARDMAIASFQTSALAQSENFSPAVEALPALSVEDAAKMKINLAKLSPEDRKLVEQQVLCVIDQESVLGVNGPPLKLMIKDRPVFFCCKGCMAEARAHPDQTLVALDKLLNRVKAIAAKK
jgi:uncharacterized protein (TIGR02231 family)